MTTPTTRLAEIAKREAFEEWHPSPGMFSNCLQKDDDGNYYHLPTDLAWKAWFARATAAQERERMYAELLREAADALDEHYDDSGNCFSCHSPCIPDPENYDDLDPSDLVHTPDCLVTKLRERADQLRGA